MLSEAFTLADKNGVSRDDLLEVINGFFPAPSIQVGAWVGGYGRRAVCVWGRECGYGCDCRVTSVGIATLPPDSFCRPSTGHQTMMRLHRALCLTCVQSSPCCWLTVLAGLRQAHCRLRV
jgi:hypothetical protein